MKQRVLFATAFLLLTVGACSDGGTSPGDMASFELIQTQIFNQNCTSCHSAGTPFAEQSGLVLTTEESYANLVGKQPTNTNARADGMLRVMAHNANGSLLFHKLSWESAHHSRDYGAPMPLGGESLYTGQIEFIRRWIEAGAPRSGSVVDVKLLDDRTRPAAQLFTPLAVPTRGFQLRIEPFTVQPQFEREIFVYKAIGNTQDIFVNRIETKMRANSHHLLLYSFSTSLPAFVRPPLEQLRDIRNPDGSMNIANMLPMAFHVFFAGAMTPASDYTFPAGVALRVPANTALDLNSHYVNKTNSTLTGEVYANLHTIDAGQVQHVARTLNLNNTNLTLPPNTRTTVTKTFLAGTDLDVAADGTVRIVALTSHMHARGERFVIRISGGPRDGEVIYTSTDWSTPTIITYSPVLVLQRGEGLTSEVTYNNNTSRTISFGLTSEDEMNIIFGYAY